MSNYHFAYVQDVDWSDRDKSELSDVMPTSGITRRGRRAATLRDPSPFLAH